MNPNEILQNAHTLMCERVLAILQNPEATVQELKVAAEFLKQNKIEALPVQGSPMGKVAEAASSRFPVMEQTRLINPAPPLQFPTFPSGDLLDDDDPVVVAPPTVVTGDGRKLG